MKKKHRIIAVLTSSPTAFKTASASLLSSDSTRKRTSTVIILTSVMMGEYPVFEDNYKSRRDMRQVEKNRCEGKRIIDAEALFKDLEI